MLKYSFNIMVNNKRHPVAATAIKLSGRFRIGLPRRRRKRVEGERTGKEKNVRGEKKREMEETKREEG